MASSKNNSENNQTANKTKCSHDDTISSHHDTTTHNRHDTPIPNHDDTTMPNEPRIIDPRDPKRLRKRRRLQALLRDQEWPRRNCLRHQHVGVGNALTCPHCAMWERHVGEETQCAHAFDGACFYCYRTSTAYRCIDCEVNFCPKDAAQHLRFPALSMHRLVSISAADARDFLAPTMAMERKGYEALFYKDWMMAADIVITCEEEEFVSPSCTETNCDITSHNNNCACTRLPCQCEPIELDYVVYMNGRPLEKAYRKREVDDAMCIECEEARRKENVGSMKRWRRVKRRQRREEQMRHINKTMNTLHSAFCQSLNQPIEPIRLPQDVPDLTDTDDDTSGLPLDEEDVTQIRPRPIKCEHAQMRPKTPNCMEGDSPLFPSSRQMSMIHAINAKDPSFVFLDPLSSSDDDDSKDELSLSSAYTYTDSDTDIKDTDTVAKIDSGIINTQDVNTTNNIINPDTNDVHTADTNVTNGIKNIYTADNKLYHCLKGIGTAVETNTKPDTMDVDAHLSHITKNPGTGDVDSTDTDSDSNIIHLSELTELPPPPQLSEALVRQRFEYIIQRALAGDSDEYNGFDKRSDTESPENVEIRTNEDKVTKETLSSKRRRNRKKKKNDTNDKAPTSKDSDSDDTKTSPIASPTPQAISNLTTGVKPKTKSTKNSAHATQTTPSLHDRVKGHSSRSDGQKVSGVIDLDPNYTTFNQKVADLLDIRGFNERLMALADSQQVVRTQKQVDEVQKKLVDLQSYAKEQRRLALKSLDAKDTLNRNEVERMSARAIEIAETTLSDFKEQRKVIEMNQLSSMIAQQMQGKVGKDGQPLREITVHKSNCPPVSVRVLKKTQRFTAAKQSSKDTSFKIKIAQTLGE